MIGALYARIITTGTHNAPIGLAEAAKVIENTQRDLKIALINELAIIFGNMGIETKAVLEAAGTKWNFLPFPGLVGGYCIGADPYYLTHTAEAIGHQPQITLAGRRLNDGRGAYAAGQLVKVMLRRRIHVNGAWVLIIERIFTENCTDLRNTRVVDVIAEMRDLVVEVDVHDPWADPEAARVEYGIGLVAEPAASAYDGILLAVAHDAFRDWGVAALRRHGAPGHVFFGLKSVFDADGSDLRL